MRPDDIGALLAAQGGSQPIQPNQPKPSAPSVSPAALPVVERPRPQRTSPLRFPFVPPVARRFCAGALSLRRGRRGTWPSLEASADLSIFEHGATEDRRSRNLPHFSVFLAPVSRRGTSTSSTGASRASPCAVLPLFSPRLLHGHPSPHLKVPILYNGSPGLAKCIFHADDTTAR